MIVVSVDVETTGFDWVSNEMIEVGAVRFDTETFEVIDSYESLIKPVGKISSEITEVTGIKMSDVENSPMAKTVLKELVDFIKDDVIVAHNYMFDARFLLSMLRKCGIDHPDFRFIDSLSISKYCTKKTKNHKLEYLVKEFYNLEPGESHRAKSDAIDVIRILKIMAKENTWDEMFLCGKEKTASQMKEFKVNPSIENSNLIRTKKYGVSGTYKDKTVSFVGHFLMLFLQSSKESALFYTVDKKFKKVDLASMKITKA